MMLLMVAGALSSANADVAVGKWKTQSDNGIVVIETCGSSICGHLSSSDQLRVNPDQLDGRNVDPKLRSRRLDRVAIFDGFSVGEDGWTGGTIYDGEDGRTYKATVTAIDADHLKVKGCIVWPLCKTQVWTRVVQP